LRVTYFARCKTPAEQECDVVIVNVTPEGCCLIHNGAAMQIGLHLLIRLESGEALHGQVRWIRDGQAGILFDEYIDRPRMEYLRREHSTFMSEHEWVDEPVQRSVS
jgi:hypothetical protein